LTQISRATRAPRQDARIIPLHGEKLMTPNVGSVDRVVRIVVGLALLAGAASGMLGAWAWIGVVPLATGIVRVCPAYLPFGLSTCATKDRAAG
jgi:hypothetical protein